MSYQLPPNLLRLFQARPELAHVPATKHDRDPRQVPKPTRRPLQGVTGYLEQIKQLAADAGQATEAEEGEEGRDEMGKELTHAIVTKRTIEREARLKARQTLKEKSLAEYNPQTDAEAQGDPFSTLFVSRLDYSVTENELRRQFEVYGPIQRVRLVTDKNGRSRGYAFIVYERERDMRTAYKEAEGMKINGRRTMVDVERGRTVKDWKPMRLGGGLGGITRKKKEPVVVVDTIAARPVGGFRGGFGGGGGRGGGFGGGGRGGFRGGGRFGGPPMGGGGAGGYGNGAPPSNGPSGGGYSRFDGPPAKRGRY